MNVFIEIDENICIGVGKCEEVEPNAVELGDDGVSRPLPGIALPEDRAETICKTLEPMLTPERIARIDGVLAARLGSVVAAVEDTYDRDRGAGAGRRRSGVGALSRRSGHPTGSPCARGRRSRR